LPEVRCFDEMTLADGAIRPVYGKIASWLAATPAGLLAARRAQAELLLRRIGITFAVYGEGEQDGSERPSPFDIIPRMMLRSEWTRLEAGLMRGGPHAKGESTYSSPTSMVPRRSSRQCASLLMVSRNAEFRPEMAGWWVPHDIYVHTPASMSSAMVRAATACLSGRMRQKPRSRYSRKSLPARLSRRGAA
jgi:uncharacterized circularly permuted ATP-grasp superfamily protein